MRSRDRGPTGVQNQQCRAAARFAAAICFAIPPGYLVGETGFEGVRLQRYKSATAHPFSGEVADCRRFFRQQRVRASPLGSPEIDPGRGDIVETDPDPCIP